MRLEDFMLELADRRQRESQAAIAAELCVSQQAVQQWLSGATRPSQMVLRLAGRVWSPKPRH